MVRTEELDSAVAQALIEEARRRQRRRYASAVGVLIGVGAAVAGSLAGIGSARPPAGKPSARPHQHHVVVVRQLAQIPESVSTSLVMWPVVADQAGGIYVDNLRTRHFWQPDAPAMDPGEYQPVLPVGRWIVWSDGAIHVVSATNPNHPKVLAKTWWFAPSVTPGHVWLQYGFSRHGQNYVRSVAVPGGQAGPPIALPAGSNLIAGTDAGLLIQMKYLRLELWKPGAAPITLPYSAVGTPVAASARMVAYETGCRDFSTAQNLPNYAGMGYPICRSLRVYDVVTGRLRTFTKPAGTIGWVPNRVGDFWSFTDIAPSDRLMAAKAALWPPGRGMARAYVLRLAGRAGRPKLVPSSTSFFLAATAWSRHGSWAFYQGPGGHLWAYQPATGRVRSSKTPCCNYEVLAPLGGRRG
jgi:hypothetical protein